MGESDLRVCITESLMKNLLMFSQRWILIVLNNWSSNEVWAFCKFIDLHLCFCLILVILNECRYTCMEVMWLLGRMRMEKSYFTSVARYSRSIPSFHFIQYWVSCWRNGTFGSSLVFPTSLEIIWYLNKFKLMRNIYVSHVVSLVDYVSIRQKCIYRLSRMIGLPKLMKDLGKSLPNFCYLHWSLWKLKGSSLHF